MTPVVCARGWERWHQSPGTMVELTCPSLSPSCRPLCEGRQVAGWMSRSRPARTKTLRRQVRGCEMPGGPGLGRGPWVSEMPGDGVSMFDGHNAGFGSHDLGPVAPVQPGVHVEGAGRECPGALGFHPSPKTSPGPGWSGCGQRDPPGEPGDSMEPLGASCDVGSEPRVGLSWQLTELRPQRSRAARREIR